MGVTGFYRVVRVELGLQLFLFLLCVCVCVWSKTELLISLVGVLPSFNQCYLVLPSFPDFYLVLQWVTSYVTVFFWVLPSFTGFLLVLLAPLAARTRRHCAMIYRPMDAIGRPRQPIRWHHRFFLWWKYDLVATGSFLRHFGDIQKENQIQIRKKPRRLFCFLSLFFCPADTPTK